MRQPACQTHRSCIVHMPLDPDSHREMFREMAQTTSARTRSKVDGTATRVVSRSASDTCLVRARGATRATLLNTVGLYSRASSQLGFAARGTSTYPAGIPGPDDSTCGHLCLHSQHRHHPRRSKRKWPRRGLSWTTVEHVLLPHTPALVRTAIDLLWLLEGPLNHLNG